MNLQLTTERSFSLIDPEFVYMTLRDDLLHSLDTSEEYREGFVEEKIRTGLAVQVKTIREDLGMKQAEFAKHLGRSQSWVSRLEDPNEPIPTVPTLLLIANKLDIGLKVSFVPFSELLDDMVTLSPEKHSVPRFRDDRRLFPRKGANSQTTNVLQYKGAAWPQVTELKIISRETSRDEPEMSIAPGDFGRTEMQKVING